MTKVIQNTCITTMHVFSDCLFDSPLSSSCVSMVAESSMVSAIPVQISCCRTASAIGITMAVVDVLLSHMERKTVQHMNPNTNLQHRERREHMQVTESVSTSKCMLKVLKYIHARFGPCDHDHPEGDAFMQVPLLDGCGQTYDPHKQQGGVLKIFRGHLCTHTQI